MIEPFNSTFLTPTKKHRRLSVLLAIYNDPKTSQQQIGELAHLSSSMVNNYIKEFLSEKLITVKGKTNRTQSYHLTPLGQNELMALFMAYSSEIIQLYGSAKRELSERLEHLHSDGIVNIALFGAAETAEVVHTAIKETPLVVKAVVDNSTDKQGKSFNGLIISAPEQLKRMDLDAVVITSFARQEEIHDSIRAIIGEKIPIKKLSEL